MKKILSIFPSFFPYQPQKKLWKDGANDIFLSQEKYAKNLVKKFGMEREKLARTLMPPSEKIKYKCKRSAN